MNNAIPASELPAHIGETVFFYDQCSKKQERVRVVGIKNGWISGFNDTTHCLIQILPSYNEKKIYLNEIKTHEG